MAVAVKERSPVGDVLIKLTKLANLLLTAKPQEPVKNIKTACSRRGKPLRVHLSLMHLTHRLREKLYVLT